MIDLKANEFLVWDELNCEAEDAEARDGGRVMTALDPGRAALQYAEEDSDGWTDGLYHEGPQPIMVRDTIGRRFRFEVAAEMVPRFRIVKQEAVS